MNFAPVLRSQFSPNTMKNVPILALAAGLALCAGCASLPGPAARRDSTKYTAENTEKFVLLDRPEQAYVACTGLQERKLADGRIQVVANIKNREKQLILVQVQCVFEDDGGFLAGGGTLWRTLVLPEDSTEAVRFTAANSLGKHYTIRVRLQQ